MKTLSKILQASITASLLLCVISCKEMEELNPLLASNGITLVAPEGAEPGDTYDINGVTYTVVDCAMPIVQQS